MNCLFDDKGNPLCIEMNNAIAFTEGDNIVEPKKVITPISKDADKLTIAGHEIIAWGENNDFPSVADEIIGQTGVLNTGLLFLRNLTIGQGIFACTVDGYDDNGNEVLKPINDKKVTNFVNSRMVRIFLEETFRDYIKFGISFGQLIPSVSGSSIAGLNAVNALYCRLTKPKDNTQMCIISGGFPDGDTSNPTVLDCLPKFNPEDFTKSIRDKKSLIYCTRSTWSNNTTYSLPIWWPAQRSGWIKIAQRIPFFLLKAYEHQVSLKWHIQIPYSFWEKQFQYSDYPAGSPERERAITAYMQKVEDNLCGAENAEKPLISMYAINEANGKIEEEWKITPLNGKAGDADRLVTSAAANSEILFSLMINPNVMGAGMPGGAYAGNQGGSNIREAFLVNVANAWIDRQNILDPIELYLKYNGVENVELRFRNTVLTTLDTGKGTKKVLS